MPRGQALAHKLSTGEGMSSMDKPRKTVYTNNGQTKITLIGKWFTMTPEEIEQDYEERLAAGDPLMRNINNTLCEVQERIGKVV